MTTNFSDILAPFFPDRSDISESGENRSLPWVLHVDDDADFSWTIKCRLEALGIAVVRAFDGADGTQCAFDYPADAILLDVNMPNGAGPDVLRWLRSDPRTSNIPVIMLTSLKDPQLRKSLLTAGANGFVTKDAPFENLVAEIKKYVDVLNPAAASS